MKIQIKTKTVQIKSTIFELQKTKITCLANYTQAKGPWQKWKLKKLTIILKNCSKNGHISGGYINFIWHRKKKKKMNHIKKYFILIQTPLQQHWKSFKRLSRVWLLLIENDFTAIFWQKKKYIRETKRIERNKI